MIGAARTLERRNERMFLRNQRGISPSLLGSRLISICVSLKWWLFHLLHLITTLIPRSGSRASPHIEYMKGDIHLFPARARTGCQRQETDGSIHFICALSGARTNKLAWAIWIRFQFPDAFIGSMKVWVGASRFIWIAFGPPSNQAYPTLDIFVQNLST